VAQDKIHAPIPLVLNAIKVQG